MFKLLRKRLFRTSKTKGFTLTELVVVVALIAIMMACLMAFARPVRQLLNGSTAKSDALTINEVLGTYLERKLSYAHNVHVFSGVTYNESDVAMSNIYDSMASSYSSDKDTPGMIVLKFDLDDDSDPKSKTFKIYEVKMKNDSSMPALDDDYLAFSNDFYGGYEYLMTCEDIVPKMNNQKKRAYLDFKIQTFDFGRDYENGLDDLLITGYYTNQDTHAVSDYIRETELIHERTNVESISFSLQNVRVKSASQVNDNGTPSDDTDDFYETDTVFEPGSDLTITRGNAPGVYGTDVVIMYNIHHYDIG